MAFLQEHARLGLISFRKMWVLLSGVLQKRDNLSQHPRGNRNESKNCWDPHLILY